MPVPEFQTLMLPYLERIRDGNEHSIAEMMDHLATTFSLSTEELEERIPSGRQTRFYNRVTWAGSHLRHAGLVENTKRGFFRITPRGLQLLDRNLTRVDLSVLDQFPEHREFRTKKRHSTSKPENAIETSEGKTPDELMDEAYTAIREALADDILEKVKTCSPRFFENLVVTLLVKMGYGGTRQDAGEAIGRSGDGGIDGIIKEDRLGLDVIYLQAKRWEGTVSRPEIQKFAGALQGRRAKKGVFITTSDFSKEAREFASAIDNKIILIDGTELAEYMIDFSVGVSPQNTYEIKRIDSDYFVEE